MVILKHVIARICSLEADSQLLKSNPSFSSHLHDTIERISEYEKRREDLLNELHHYNTNVSEKKVSNAIQNIRRNIYNRKIIKSKDKEVLEAAGESYVLGILTAFVEMEHDQGEHMRFFERQFLQEWFEKRKELVMTAKSNSVSNGLLPSSFSLLEALENIRQENESPNKKERQVETSLLKYVIRSMFKPSPFSSFAQLNYATVGNSAKNIFCDLEDSKDYKSFIRVNNGIFQKIRKFLIEIEEISLHLKVKLNPSITFDPKSNSYKVLINKNNLEYFQTIEKTAVAALIFDFISKSINVRLIEVVAFCKEHIEADQDSIKKYIIKLVNIGFIECDFMASGTDIEWIEKLYQELPGIIQSEARDILIDLLQDLKQARVLYEEQFLSVKGRKEILNQISDKLNKHFIQLTRIGHPEISFEKIRKDQYKKESIFLEDTLSFRKIKLKDDFLRILLDKINDLVNYCSQYSFFNLKQKELWDFFNQHYIVGELPLLAFYEDYCRDLKSRQNEKKEDGRPAFQEYPQDLTKIFDVVHKSESEINFSYSKDVESVGISTNHSLSMFFQITDMDSNPGIVVNGLGWGYGKMSSRFLYMFEPDFTEDIKKMNSQLAEDVIYSEINDASFFNANLHPPLFSHECVVPGGHTNVEDSFQLNVNELLIKKDAEIERLILIDRKSRKQVFIHDSCLQGDRSRSQLFNLLVFFSDKVNPVINPILTEFNRNNLYRKNENVMVFPRIIYEGTMVLQRKYWIIDNLDDLKIRDTETEGDYFLRVLTLLEELEIPRQVFVTLNFSNAQDKVFSRDDYKPQFIDFENPVFLPLIVKLLKKAKRIKIVEMLPSKDAALDFGNAKHTTEFLIQWYNGEKYDRK